MRFISALCAALALLIPHVASQALAEPSGNQVYIGFWVATEEGDTPLKLNERVGFNQSVFQIAQTLPQPAFNFITARLHGIGDLTELAGRRRSSTCLADRADVHRCQHLPGKSAATRPSLTAQTVYPQSTSPSDADLLSLGSAIKIYNRVVFLRWAPEMQGLWFPAYGFAPSRYVPMFRRMYTAIKAIAPNVIIMWAPNMGNGYPYGQTAAPEEFALLDTNRDGVITENDDPYTPYYPGDDFVDWIGISVYYKSRDSRGRNYNLVQTDDFCGRALTGRDVSTGEQIHTNFYEQFCQRSPRIACAFAESGAAWHAWPNVTALNPSVTQADLMGGWIRGCLLNATMYDTYPRLKMVVNFEYEKIETDGGIPDLRDFRVTNSTAVLDVYRQAYAPVADRFVHALVREPPANIPATGRPADVIGGAASSTPHAGVVFQTARVWERGPPTLFGVTAGAARTLQVQLAAAGVSAVVGAASVLIVARRGRIDI